MTMTIHYDTSKNSKNSVAFPKELLIDPNLDSLELRVLVILIADMPEPNPQAKYLSTNMSEGVYAIQNAVNRLKKKGYIVRHECRNALGRIVSVKWSLNLNPEPNEYMRPSAKAISAATELKKILFA